MKRSSNFTAKITSPDFSFDNGDWVKCSRMKIKIEVAGREGIGQVDGCTVECAPMANGKLEIRIWIHDRYYRKQFTVFGGLIDWSVVDGRSVSEEDKISNKAKVKEARSILKKKTRKRVLRVKFRGQEQRDQQGREGSVLSEESDIQIGREDVRGAGVGQEREANQNIGQKNDEGPFGDLGEGRDS